MQYEKEELIDVLKEIIGVMKDGELDYISIKNDKFELELGKKPTPPPAMPPIAMPIGGMTMPTAPTVPAATAPDSTAPKAEPKKSVKSPIVGTFYAAPSPTKPPFVKVGDKINVGDVVCIVESMKVMNEIQAEVAGTVASIAVNDGDAVEYGQPLIILE